MVHIKHRPDALVVKTWEQGAMKSDWWTVTEKRDTAVADT